MKASASRLRAACSALDRDQRFAAGAAAALFVTMFLPWYEKSVFDAKTGKPEHDSISAFGAVSFVEAAIFLVSVGVLVLVLTRAEGGTFHLPGGDGSVILAAGLWASALIFYRVFDRPNINGDGVGASVGIQWGFFVAFVAAGTLAYAGGRMRAAARSEAPVRKKPPRRPRADPSEDDTELVSWSAPPPPVVPDGPRTPRDRAVRREDAEQITLEDPPDAPLTRDRG